MISSSPTRERPPVETHVPTSPLVLVLFAQFCIFAAVGTVNIALPAIGQHLAATSSQLQWILLSFQLGFALLLVTGGRLGDLHGTRVLFLWGFGGFVFGNLVAALAPSPELLLTARLLQGICGGLAAPQILATIQIHLDRHATQPGHRSIRGDQWLGLRHRSGDHRTPDKLRPLGTGMAERLLGLRALGTARPPRITEAAP